MKQKTLLMIWGLFALAFLAVSVTGSPVLNYEAIMSFPYVQIGRFLRKLSLSGATGNLISVVIYIGLSSVPIAYFSVRMLKKKAKAEDFLLIIAGIFLFVMLYLFINPAFMIKIGNVLSVKSMLGGSFYSILIGYIILRMLRKFGESEIEDMLTILERILIFIGAVLIYSVLGSGLAELMNSIESLKLNNTAPDVSTEFTNFFFVLRFIFELIPSMFQLTVIYLATKLCNELMADRYSEDVIFAARKLGVYCKYSVAITMLLCITVNLFQVIFAKHLLAADYRMNIPLFPIVLLLIVLLAAKYFAESKVHKEENDMFI
ncbi:MAG: hypothetical protein GX660_14490 [Clostridiaceae bacterium]|nr:hypothetical protein [Clostridiaceae bacterium]